MIESDSRRQAVAWAIYVAGPWTWVAASGDPLPAAARRANLARDYAAWRLESLESLESA